MRVWSAGSRTEATIAASASDSPRRGAQAGEPEPPSPRGARTSADRCAHGRLNLRCSVRLEDHTPNSRSRHARTPGCGGGCRSVGRPAQPVLRATRRRRHRRRRRRRRRSEGCGCRRTWSRCLAASTRRSPYRDAACEGCKSKTAIAGTDYTAASGTVIFVARQPFETHGVDVVRFDAQQVAGRLTYEHRGCGVRRAVWLQGPSEHRDARVHGSRGGPADVRPTSLRRSVRARRLDSRRAQASRAPPAAVVYRARSHLGRRKPPTSRARRIARRRVSQPEPISA